MVLSQILATKVASANFSAKYEIQKYREKTISYGWRKVAINTGF